MEFREDGKLKVWYRWTVFLVKKTTAVGCLLRVEMGVVEAKILLATVQLLQNLL